MTPTIKKSNIIIVLIGLTTLIFLCGCVKSKAKTPESVAQAPRGVTLVMPFVDMAQLFGSNTSVRNPVTSKVFVTGTIEEDAVKFMTNEIYRHIGQHPDLKWGYFQQLPGHTALRNSKIKANHLENLLVLGRYQGADTVMIGYLYAFRNRNGGNYGVESPAKVVFELVLIQCNNGRIIWQRSFQETQKPLSEDLLQLKQFLKRKGRWVSAREMASSALKEMLETLEDH